MYLVLTDHSHGCPSWMQDESLSRKCVADRRGTQVMEQLVGLSKQKTKGLQAVYRKYLKHSSCYVPGDEMMNCQRRWSEPKYYQDLQAIHGQREIR